MEEKYGNVKVDNEVLASIAAIAARKVPGVHRIFTSIVGGIVQWIKRTADAGIKVVIGEDEVSFELRVVIDYGVNIPEVTYQIQKAIKEEVERISGLKVGNVDVIVHGIHFPKKEIEEEEKND
ncbi:MAG: Asp23/Gls24 family envelope stress response protein [Candidatus Omnitrophica bacterium]|nr:Asp23/Gls24 family envelope stress response protein [Candidatus Omnitrophota bacterium]MCM8777205.1 Asp23/Gls24 family envelope stress response protein [Candidatus Omnitrophota bacterium]